MMFYFPLDFPPIDSFHAVARRAHYSSAADSEDFTRVYKDLFLLLSVLLCQVISVS